MITVLHNQSPLDISVQEYGTIEAVFELAVANGIGVTDELTTGSKLEVPDVPSEYIDTEVRDYYKKHNIRPVTGSTVVGETTIPQSADSCGWKAIEW